MRTGMATSRKRMWPFQIDLMVNSPDAKRGLLARAAVLCHGLRACGRQDFTDYSISKPQIFADERGSDPRSSAKICGLNYLTECNRALRMAPAVCQRCAGSFASARSMMSQTGCGMWGARWRNGTAGCSKIERIVSFTLLFLLRSKARQPVNKLYAVIPTPYMSDCGLTSRKLRSCSGG